MVFLLNRGSFKTEAAYRCIDRGTIWDVCVPNHMHAMHSHIANGTDADTECRINYCHVIGAQLQ
jgi:hypothetical protein